MHPKPTIAITRDTRVEYQSANEVLGWKLEQDVQVSATTCDELLRICDEIENGNRNDWEGSGNGRTVSIAGDGVTIENEFSDTAQACAVSIDEFRTAVMSWKELLRTAPS
jgi:hypothetical protein